MISLAEGDFVYIRNEGDGGEELFNRHDDPDELHNIARVEAMLRSCGGFATTCRRRRPVPRPPGIPVPRPKSPPRRTSVDPQDNSADIDVAFAAANSWIRRLGRAPEEQPP